jgi:hypothetical protein
MVEGPGSGSVPLTNGSGRPKKLRTRNTGSENSRPEFRKIRFMKKSPSHLQVRLPLFLGECGAASLPLLEGWRTQGLPLLQTTSPGLTRFILMFGYCSVLDLYH